MKKKTLSLIIILVVICPVIAYAQKVIAPSVAEWEINGKFGSDYRYNSVAVFLINPGNLPNLFTGKNMSKENRKKIGLGKWEYAPYIYLYLEIDNPKNNSEKFTFPLYLTDAVDKKNIKYKEKNQNIVIDSISDDSIDHKNIVATGKIMVIKKNKSLEFFRDVLTITKDLFKTAHTISKSAFGTEEIISTLENRANIFEKISKGKVVENEFQIPILNNIKSNHEYKLYSASLHQLKWEFTPVIPDPWNDLKQNDEVSIDELKKMIDNKENIEEVYKKHCYLLVARYRSQYTLPDDYITNIEIKQSYIDERAKILDFIGPDNWKYDMEDNLLKTLMNALSLKKDYDVYYRKKELGESDSEDVIVRIINSYYEVKDIHYQELTLNNKSRQRASYFDEKYKSAYKKIFEEVDRWLKDSDLTQVKKMIQTIFELKDQDLTKLPKRDLYPYVNNLSFYRGIIQKLNLENKPTAQIEKSADYGVVDSLLKSLETNLYKNAFVLEGNLSTEEKKLKLSNLMQTYKQCEYCKKQAQAKKIELDKIDDETKRSRLQEIKNAWIITSKCYYDFLKAVKEGYEEIGCKKSQSEKDDKAPDQQLQKILCEEYKNNLDQLELKIKEFIAIRAIDIQELESEKLDADLNKFLLIQSDIKQLGAYLIKALKEGNNIEKEPPGCLMTIK